MTLTPQTAKELVEAAKAFCFGDPEMENIIWGNVADDEPVKTTAPWKTYRRLRAALSQAEKEMEGGS